MPAAQDRERSRAAPGSVVKKGTPEYTSLKQRVEAAFALAHESMADCEKTIARTRQLLQEMEELFQHIRARKERDIEQKPPLLINPPPRDPHK